MTLLEKLRKEHPVEAECYTRYCPDSFGYMTNSAYKGRCILSLSCDECWAREIPEKPAKTEQESEVQKAYKEGYEEGYQETWELAKKIALHPVDGGYTMQELKDIFGKNSFVEIFNKSYEEIKELHDYYLFKQEEKEKIHVGDVVISNDSRCVVVATQGKACIRILSNEGKLYIVQKVSVEKTGDHINLTEIFKKLGGAADGQ